MWINIRMHDVMTAFEEFFQERRRELFPDVELMSHHSHYSPKVLAGVLNSPGFFRDLPAIPGAIAAVMEMIRQGHTVLIRVTPLKCNKRGEADQESWLNQRFGEGFSCRHLIVKKDPTTLPGDLYVSRNVVRGSISFPAWKLILFKPEQEVPGIQSMVSWEDWSEALTAA